MPDDIKALAKKLRRLSSEEFSKATASAINTVAFAANEEQKTSVSTKFINRNKYTAGSMMMFKASPKKDANKIDALVGSKSPYLPEQETGGTVKTRRGRPAISMPTKKARRGNWNKPISPKLRMDKIRNIGRRSGGGKMLPKGTPYFWLSGGQLKNTTLFERRGFKLIRIRIVTRGPIKLNPTHWHTEAMAKHGNAANMSTEWGKELSKGLAKLGAT